MKASEHIHTDDKWNNVLAALGDLEQSGLSEKVASSLEAIYRALTTGWTLMLGYSSGKDSETVLHLFLMALMRVMRTGKITSRHHFILHTNTLIENPEIHALARKKLNALQEFIDRHGLPLTIVIAEPAITSSWTGRILTGRGLPTFTNSSARQCTHELKINAAHRAKATFMEGKRLKGRICLLLGSRDAESTTRARNIAKKQGSSSNVIKTREGGELYAIKNWRAEDVWEFLLSCGNRVDYPLPSYLPDNTETAEMYRSATGECVWTTHDKKQSDACGARFGCWACQAVGLDKSMQTMLSSDPERYGYMEYLSRIQRFLAKRRYAWEDRHPVGRTIYGTGYIKIQPDVYSPLFLERLLHICCSVDFVEQLRADVVKDELLSGNLEDTEYNRRMSEPQFRIVSESALIHIDFLWAFHHFNAKPFRALEIFHQVWTHHQLDLLNDELGMTPVARTPIPAPIWVKVGKRWDNGSGIDGLSDPLAEMVYFDGSDDPRAARQIMTPEGAKRVVSYCEDDELTVDQEAAEFIVWCDYPVLRDRAATQLLKPGGAAQYYLRFGVVQIAAGKAAMYDRMMQRGQRLYELGLSGKQTMDEIARRRDLRVISDDKFRMKTRKTIQARMTQMRFWCALYLILSQYQDTRGDFRPILVTSAA
ncbi:phosphoadenosine phosphosulfate reductase family protein [Dickeya sp. NCPPB 3274]|uniref:phosphoadenosine phosphosulfate reductase domain-containing protein n=1 Tax=Dickeya sp. NCPPB 3274 TaxID=568766 RepID=UPI0003A54BA1|nr:phosphoadenosine phosphosulfate reductase family protein [Dickeya sp. NCPPB 3274]